MSVLSLLNPLGWFGGYRAKLSGGSAPGQQSSLLVEASAAGVAVTPEIALQLDVAWACVKLIAQTMGTLPMMLYRLDAEGQRTAETKNPLYDLLAFQPNADNTATEFWEACGACLALWGDFYAAKAMEGDQIVALNILRPFWMTALRTKDGTPIYRYDDPQNGRTDFRQEDLFHVKGFGFGDLVGLSPIAYGRQTLGRAIATNDAAGALFRNGLRTPGYFEYKGAANGGVLSDEQRDRAKKAIIEPMQGSQNAGTPGILPASFGWVALGMNAVDAEMISNRRISAEEICRTWGVPPVLVGHSGDSQSLGVTGLEQILRFFMTTGLRPYLHRTETAIGRDLIGRDKWKTLRAMFDVDELLRGDSKAQSDVDMQDVNSGLRTRNEARARRGLPRVEGGDTLTVNGALMPIMMLGQKPPTGGDGSGQGGDPKPEPGDLASLPNGGLPDKPKFEHAFSWQRKDYDPSQVRDNGGKWTSSIAHVVLTRDQHGTGRLKIHGVAAAEEEAAERLVGVLEEQHAALRSDEAFDDDEEFPGEDEAKDDLKEFGRTPAEVHRIGVARDPLGPSNFVSLVSKKDETGNLDLRAFDTSGPAQTHAENLSRELWEKNGPTRSEVTDKEVRQAASSFNATRDKSDRVTQDEIDDQSNAEFEAHVEKLFPLDGTSKWPGLSAADRHFDRNDQHQHVVRVTHHRAV